MNPRRLHSDTITSMDVIGSPRLGMRLAQPPKSSARLVCNYGPHSHRNHKACLAMSVARSVSDVMGVLPGSVPGGAARGGSARCASADRRVVTGVCREP